MSSTDTELRLLLVKYIDKYEGKEELREVLKKTSASSRYEVLVSCRGTNGWTSAMRSAVNDDVATLECMLVGLSSEQIYEVMKFSGDNGSVPLHEAAYKGHTDIIMYILCNLSLEDRFNTLKLTNNYGLTAAHWAAAKNKPEALQLLLTSVTPEQQRELLAIKTNKGKTVRNLITLPDLSYDYFSAKELANAWLKIQALESQVETQAAELGTAKKRVDELESLWQEQRITITRQDAELHSDKERIQQLESRLAEEENARAQQAAALQRLSERQEEMQRALRQMDEFNRRCFSTADTGDQDHEF